ncbi:MAG: 2Fe-2S ferredoxin [Ahrensia sp.]|nr:2Fe-2S ferredoxin [Ahrensia sp.]
MTLMEAAVRNDVPGIIAECGGAASCATCHVILDDERADKVPPRSDIEDDMLDFAESERQANSRLSCQLVMSRDLDGVRLIVPQG